MRICICLIAMLFCFVWATPSFGAQVQASSSQEGFAPELAADQNTKSAWCAATQSPPDNTQIQFEGRTYHDWWESEFEKDIDTVGAIHMRSGFFENDRVTGHKIRDFVWVYQRAGETEWHKIPETQFWANRYQLIFRFEPIHKIAKIRLLIRGRSAEELRVTGAHNPCLREVAFYPDKNASIPVKPWFLAVSTWEDGFSVYAPLKYWAYRAFRIEDALLHGLNELYSSADPDFFDSMGISEFNAGESWVLHEPQPNAFLLSGNYRNYSESSPKTFEGFYSFVRKHYKKYPILGACGGHQLLAMTMTHPTLAGFESEFKTDSMDQSVITCSTNPSYACNGRSPVECCYEGGHDNPFRTLVPNLPGIAIPNPYQNSRVDMLLNQLSLDDGFRAYFFHHDYVEPKKIAPYFDIIATYPESVGTLSSKAPSLVQAMKLKNYPVYGTQFHWDENFAGTCNRDDGYRNMERILKNFVFIALNKLSNRESFSLRTSSSSQTAQKITDLDRDSAWCSHSSDPEPAITVKLSTPQQISRLVMVEGLNSKEALEQTHSFTASSDGIHWRKINAHRQSLHKAQTGCDPLPGIEDDQSAAWIFDSPVYGQWLRIHIRHRKSEPSCMSELMIYE
jgi:GMP synthase-like glutamine amidotransferase